MFVFWEKIKKHLCESWQNKEKNKNWSTQKWVLSLYFVWRHTYSGDRQWCYRRKLPLVIDGSHSVSWIRNMDSVFNSFVLSVTIIHGRKLSINRNFYVRQVFAEIRLLNIGMLVLALLLSLTWLPFRPHSISFSLSIHSAKKAG